MNSLKCISNAIGLTIGISNATRPKDVEIPNLVGKTVDEAKEGDVSEKINDITLIAEEKLVDEFGGFRLLSSEENGGRGLSLKPVIEVEGGCGSCGGGCHH